MRNELRVREGRPLAAAQCAQNRKRVLAWSRLPFRQVLSTSLCLFMIGLCGFALAQQPAKAPYAPIPVRYTDIRKSAGITFLQDNTRSEEKYYLETMGT